MFIYRLSARIIVAAGCLLVADCAPSAPPSVVLPKSQAEREGRGFGDTPLTGPDVNENMNKVENSR